MAFGTVSIISTPQQFEPVNTDGLWFRMNSGSYSTSNFKYIVDVHSWNLNPSSATVSLGRFKLPPRPVTGDGIFTPHPILKTQITNSLITPITATGVNLTYGAMVQYYIDYGFEMNPQLPYADFKFAAVGGTYGTVFGISFSQAHNLQKNDVIYVDKTNQKVNLSYNGYQVVTGVPTSTFITTDVPYSGVTVSAGTDVGIITSLSRIQGTTYESFTQSDLGNYTWNSIRQYMQKGYDFSAQYVATGGLTQSFLTNYYEGSILEFQKNMKPTRLDTYETLGVILNGDKSNTAAKVDHLYYFAFDSSYNVLEQASSPTFSIIDYKGKFEVGVGVKNLQDLFGGSTLTNPNIYGYKVGLRNSATILGFPTVLVSRRIDRNCTSYENIQIMWLNRMGSFEFWNFYRNSKETVDVTKTEWKKQLAWDYTVGDRQQSVLSQQAQSSYTINSDWVSEYDYRFLQELITSPEVFKIVGTTPIPIVVTDTKWVQKTAFTDQVFNLTLNFKDSFLIRTQNN